jgi:hypothetical protein
MNIEYDPVELVQNGGAKLVYAIIPLNRWEQDERRKRVGKHINEYDIEKISEYPGRYAGSTSRVVFSSSYRSNQSMYDFVNVFTEHAHQHPIWKKLDIEEAAGKLSSWIFDNRKKFA